MIDFFHNWLSSMGLNDIAATVIANTLTWIIVVVLAILSKVFFEKWLIKPLEKIIGKTFPKWSKIIQRRRVLKKAALLAPGIVFYAFAPVFPILREAIMRFASAYLIFIAAIIIDALLDTVTDSFQSMEIGRERPIKSYATVIKIVMYIIVGVLVVSNLANTSPWGILSGIGAMTAVLLVIFRDSLLGLVASVQISKNELVSIGDWIEMPKYQADGDVIDITLTTVRIQNWDRTITTIPSYALISESFKNWKGMFESGGRRIKRCIYIDMQSVRFLDEELLAQLKQIQLIQPYIDKKKDEIHQYNIDHGIDESVLVNGRRMTNIGTFRAYVYAYIKNHPGIHQGLIMMVRQLQPTDAGIPLEIYAFTKDTAWINYEGIQSDIMDHILAVVPHFDLRVFQNPSGADLRALSKE